MENIYTIYIESGYYQVKASYFYKDGDTVIFATRKQMEEDRDEKIAIVPLGQVLLVVNDNFELIQ